VYLGNFISRVVLNFQLLNKTGNIFRLKFFTKRKMTLSVKEYASVIRDGSFISAVPICCARLGQHPDIPASFASRDTN